MTAEDLSIEPVARRLLGDPIRGVLDVVEQETVCCHATQDKLWSHEPQGLRWEWYRITDDDPDGVGIGLAAKPSEGADGGACCS